MLLAAGILGLKASQMSLYVASGVRLVAYGLGQYYLPASHTHLAVRVGSMANGLSFWEYVLPGAHAVQDRPMGATG